jgi:hypothetical protein
VLVGGQTLAQDPEHGLLVGLRHRRVAVGLDEPLDPAAAQPLGQRVPALVVALGARLERRRDDDEAGHPLGMVEREAQDRVGAIDAPASTARSMPRSSSTASRSPARSS